MIAGGAPADHLSNGNDMVPLLLFLILLVIAWPVFAVFGGTLLGVLGSHLHIIVPTILISVAYIAFLTPIARRNNIKLGGKMGEALDPSKPIGPEFQSLMQESGDAPPVKASLFNAPDQWKRVPRDPEYRPRHGQSSPVAKAHSPKRAIALAALVFIVAAPLTVLLIDQGAKIATGVNGPSQAGPSVVAPTSQLSADAGRWLVRPDQSVTLEAISGTNFLGQPVVLTVWCNTWPNLKLDFHDYLGSDQGVDGFKTVILQVGTGAVQEFRMALGPDQTTLLLDSHSSNLIQSFLREGVFSVYTAPYNSEPVTAKFDLTGAKTALGPMLNSCKPAAYALPEKATVSFHGDGGMIHVLKTGDEFPFTRTSPPGVELLYGDCRMAVGQYCMVGLTLNGNNLARIWSARVPVGSP